MNRSIWKTPGSLRQTAFALSLLLVFALAARTEDIRWNDHRAESLSSKQALRNARVSERERAAIASAIQTQLALDNSLLNISNNEDLEDIVLDSPVKLIDLNGDGVREVIVQGPGGGSKACSPTGNCPFWIFQKTGDGYKLILDGMAQAFHIERRRTNGWKDVVLSMHGSATSSSLTLFQFGKSRYVDTECYRRDWDVLEGSELRKLKKPRIAPCRQE